MEFEVDKQIERDVKLQKGERGGLKPFDLRVMVLKVLAW
jgi:hypothetical protein